MSAPTAASVSLVFVHGGFVGSSGGARGRRVLSAAARRDVAAAIVDYQRSLTPLVVPLRLIEHYARLHDVGYLCDQTYLNPYPHELMLRNHV